MVNMPHWPLVPIWKTPIDRNLKNFKELMNALGNPQNKLPPTIHIAGTNGKGSTVAMLKSIYEKAGYSVHTYTTPKIIEFNEVIKLKGKKIPDEYLYDILERTRLKSEELKQNTTFFEGTTAAAFLAFSEVKADLLILETGLGGRLDCTNIVEKPIMTIITPISKDHTEYLGEDILQIAEEKAGIIKKNVPCVISAQQEIVYNLLLGKCEQMSAPAFCYEYDYCIEKNFTGFRYLSKKHNLDLPKPKLQGDHQLLNASAVLAAVMLLNDKFKISTEHIVQGITQAKWAGRMQYIEKKDSNKLLDDNIDLYIDGAHNSAGALCLADWLKNQELEGKKLYMVVGMTRNRNVEDFISNFYGIIDKAKAIRVSSEPSSYSSSILAERINKSGINCDYHDDLNCALENIKHENNGQKAIVIIAGSLFLIADLFKLLNFDRQKNHT